MHGSYDDVGIVQDSSRLLDSALGSRAAFPLSAHFLKVQLPTDAQENDFRLCVLF